ncbi:hypothetical protein GUITHDRAFT_160010 [Guillardia theta CCMP2712]|uniref:Cytoplasmic dynein 2 heavy chain 1 n=3 Tax=Guillardia theta TaxID=55529 RepID=L1IU85_GUITC|nr:hypothetical protein GUITHDRAFT_160010 [Guillardia theta CCMP2712]EKX39469.1 hypothetical protein GUITHDRAFT_160010 [Guillardia theta CCMP2712]|eukprot:XP_005826449.1 hypothetical protein GUITHDRAFT_160010 [Guillardia theta CCMP2712]
MHFGSSSSSSFLDDPTTTALLASLRNDEIVLANSVTERADEGSILFHKTGSSAITMDNFQTSVSMSSFARSPLHSLYDSLHNIYKPLMLRQTEKLDDKTMDLLQNLEAALEFMVKGHRAFSSNLEDCVGILSLEDEVNFWHEQSMRDPSAYGDLHGQMRDLNSIFENVNDETFESIESEIMENVKDAVDNIWKEKIPERRMRHLFGLVGDKLMHLIRKKVDSSDIWNIPFQQAESHLNAANSACKRWLAVTKEMTGVMWVMKGQQPLWQDKAYVDERFLAISMRLEKILELRTSHEALRTLLSEDEQRGLKLDNSLKKLADVHPLSVSSYSTAAWTAAVSEYSAIIEPASLKVSEKLRDMIASKIIPNLKEAVEELKDVRKKKTSSSSALAKPYQVLKEFDKYKDLIRKPALLASSKAERRRLFEYVKQYLLNLREYAMQQTDDSDAKLYELTKSKNCSTTVNNVVLYSQLIHKVQMIKGLATPIFVDISEETEREEHLDFVCDNIFRELEEKKMNEFTTWRDDMKAALRDSEQEVAIDMKGKLMSFDKADGRLRVHYSEKLVELIREARQLCAIGHPIPKEIDEEVEKAQKIYNNATILKQVAAFYNTLESHIIKSQKPMLINEAVDFERVVKGDGRSITWGDTNMLAQYTEELQTAMRRFTNKNRRLRKAHEQIAEIVVKLMETDLVRQRDKWKYGLQEIKKIVQEVAQEGFDNLKAWYVHWDYQLYKALEFQYKVGLESCHETLPQIEVTLYFKDKKLTFDPPFEDIRQRYYKDLMRFINIPLKFKGVGETDIFKNITECNPKGLQVVFQQAEKLFKKLLDAVDKYSNWVALGTVDLDELVEEKVKEVEDWDSNFRVLKTRTRDAEKLDATVKVDCITVDTTPLKQTIEKQLKDFNDALVRSLKKSAEADMEQVHEYTRTSLEALASMPQSVDEIAEATGKWKAVNEGFSGFSERKLKMEEKSRLIKLQGGSSIDFSELHRDWDELELRLSAHAKNVEEQKEKLRSLIEQQIKSFRESITKFSGRWRGMKPHGDELKDRESAEKAIEIVKDLDTEYSLLADTAVKIKQDCTQFEMSEPSFPELEELQEDVQQTLSSWRLYDEYTKEIGDIENEAWLEIRDRLYVLDDFLAKWADKVKGKDIDPVVRYLLSEIERLRKNVPYLKFVKGDAFTQEHWFSLFRLLEFPKGVDRSNLKLRYFLDSSDLVVSKMNEIKDLQARATAELSIQEAFDELLKWGEETEFTLIEHKDCSGRTINLIKEWKEVQTQVGDHQSVLQAMKDSPYFGKFAVQAEDWDRKLSTLGIGLSDLNTIQRKWLYLEPIFGRGALPHEQQRFKRVDEDYRDIMVDIVSNRRVVSFAEISGILEKLPGMINQLERCQKALSDFLEEKRSKFPRFYFIGDDDLLEILGQSKNPTVIQAHLKKLFQAIFAVDFSEDQKHIVSFRSLEGETVALLNPIEITDVVEQWLSDLSTDMVLTLSSSLSECMSTIDFGVFPSMILCAVEQICFCADVEASFSKGGLHGIESALREKLAQYTGFAATSDPVVTLKFKSTILDLIHDLDVLSQLKKEGVVSADSWHWQKQLRFYLEDNKCVVRMCDTQNSYTYEYQGNDPKLVHTPLTDKCFLTLTQALHLGYGGNPYGPAGTGKTESVKALGQALARQVLVFNCDEGIDFKSMGRIFTGLVKCGAWGCFDEFNRLEPEVLSAVSQQIQTIQGALKEKRPKLNLLGTEIDVNPDSGIFVTLNPAGKGYGGRSELPDNLKQLFRSVAMSAPDNALIAEVILYAEGYRHANVIGAKVVELFTLSRQLLSRQQHYDWGLRALKTILLISGKLFALERRTKESISQKEETELLIKAVRLNTLAKLTFEDTKKFEDLILDIFPGIIVSDAVYKDLEEAIEASLAEMKLDLLPSQMKKVVQLNENLSQRMGCVIVGPSGSGKSTLLRILRSALAKLKQEVVIHTMNPKAMPRQQLLGHMDLDTREWFDGVLTASARQVVKEPPEVRSWIICDGDIDPEWVESLNSVLDDNRLLTMPSGERIRFGPNVNFIFETNDLRFASPATVSRMGMIFLSEKDMQISCLVKAWVDRQPEASRPNLTAWLDQSFYKGLDWVLLQPPSMFVVQTTKVGIALNALSSLVGVELREQFACALSRGLGSILVTSARQNLAKEIFESLNERPISTDRPLDTYFDLEAKSYAEYAARTDSELSAKDLIMSSPTERDLPVVLTKDLLRTSDVFAPWMQNFEPFLLVGPEGCGKSTMLRAHFQKFRNVEVAVLNCNAQTSAIHVIQKLQHSCTVNTSQSGRVYRPKAERLILYLKDINLPKPDKYDTIQLISFLQQIILYQGFYDGLEWMGIERVQLVCSMNPSTTIGRHNLTTRFTAILRVAAVSYPENDQLQLVYSSYLRAIFSSYIPKHPTWSDKKSVERLAGTLIQFYERLKTTFVVDEHRHYLFTPRDVTALVIGLMRYEITTHEVLDVLAYEAQRIFRDRLVGEDAMRSFDSSVLGDILRTEWNHKVDLKNTFFTTWLYAGEKNENFQMLGRSGGEDLEAVIQQGITLYEREFKELDIVLFPEVVERIARLDRILSQPGGSGLLIGRPGVGRRTCLSIACYLHKMEIFIPKIGRGYDMKQFINDLKVCVQVTGVQGTPYALFLEDYQLVDSSLLQVINGLLSSGEVPGMFTSQELDAMTAPLQEEFRSQGYKYRNLYSFFVSRVQKNLHIFLSLDPLHPDFLLRCESNPALYTRCTILWLETWSKHGMSRVPKHFLQDTLEQMDSADAMIDNMQFLHWSVTSLPVCPRDYVTLLHTIKKLYEVKRGELERQTSFLKGGLNRLEETWDVVETLSKNASDQELQIKEKDAQAKQKMSEIKLNMQEATQKRSEAEELSQKLKVSEAEMQEKRAKVESELAECQPVLEAAKLAVGNIKKDNLNEIRSFKLPPESIRDVLEGVLRLMNNQDTSWVSIKRFISQPSVIQEILNFDARQITRDVRESVLELLHQKAASFRSENIQRVSLAAAPLASWVKAQVQYSAALEHVKPLEDQLQKLDKSLESSRQRKNECDVEIRKADETASRLSSEYETLTKEAAELSVEYKKVKERLDAAENLLGKLKDENDRWKLQMQDLNDQMGRLPLSVLLASAFITYLGGMPEDMRSRYLLEWCQRMELRDFRFIDKMSTETERLKWKSQGLPGDDLSTENAIVIQNCQLYPLIVDPSTQAAKWLRTMLETSGLPLETTTQQDPKFLQKLELSVRFGRVFVMEEVDKLEPFMFALLRKDLVRQGPRWMIQIGEKLIDFNENFKFFMITRNPSIEVPPDGRPLITDVNFSITKSGLESQLLALTIQHEKPKLEVEKSELLQKEEELKMSLSELEKQLLQQLAESQGNVLENKELIQKLTDIKNSSIEIKDALRNSAELQLKLDDEREVYRPFARTASGTFFLIQALKSLNYMYQFDLPTYIFQFQNTLKNSSSANEVEDRLRILVSTLKRNLFYFVGRSLFKDDRLTFGMHLVHGMNPEMFADMEWDFFVGLTVSDTSSSGFNPPEWLPADRAPSLLRLAATLPSLVSSLNLQDSKSWLDWFNSVKPEVPKEFPSQAAGLRAFKRMLILQALRPDRLQSAMELFVGENLGVQSSNIGSLDLRQLSQETSERTPIMFIVTPGSDPSAILEQEADQILGPGNYRQIAMGQGQAENAIRMLNEAANEGTWLCLQNVHLVVSWLPVVEKILHSIQPQSSFRLWMTTEPHPRFPPILLQQSVKVTFEAPPGLKRNLLNAYSLWTPEFVSKMNQGRSQLLFVLAWFHAIVQERRTYLPQGWTKFHEFSYADLRSTAEIISTTFTSGLRNVSSLVPSDRFLPADNPKWETLHGLLDNAIYGGRIDNIYDQRILRACLKMYFRSDNIHIGGSQARPLPNTKGILVPNSTSHSDFLSVIKQLPEVDAPSLLGLPPNIERVLQQTNSAKIANQLKTMETADVKLAGWDRERMSAQLKPVISLWQNLVNNPKVLKAPKGSDDASLPVDSFIVMEAQDAHKLVRLVHVTIEAVSRVLKGVDLLTTSVQSAATCLASGTVLDEWSDQWEGPETLALWLEAVVKKKLAIDSWLELQKSGNSLSAPISPSWLLNPQIFLNALRQQTARMTKVAVDELTLACVWGEGSRSQLGSVTCVLQGLVLQGALFSGGYLAEAKFDTPSVVPLPSCTIAFIPSREDDSSSTSMVELPVYERTDRSKFLMRLRMSCKVNEQDRWILCGAAIFISAD